MKMVLSVLAGFITSLIIVKILGSDPTEVLVVLGRSSLGSFSNLLGTLSYATPLIFTGLSVALAFHCGLFNIGGEGQLYLGSLFLTAFCLYFSNLSAPLSIILATAFAILGGGLWGALAGALKARRGSHEVIVTIMLNFIAYAICSYFILGILKNPHSQNPETAELTPSFFIPHLSQDSSLNFAFVIALVTAFSIWFLLYKTVWGQEVRIIGTQLETAKRCGINVKRRITQAMFLSGGLSGLVALHEILGNSHKFRDQFSPGYGFIGIAVALLAKNNPVFIILSAILFGALAKGSLDLELDTEKITRDMALMIQGLIILFLSAGALWDKWRFTKNASI